MGEALKRSIDCRDLACLRAERVEEIIRAQSRLMGVPRSVGDFFTWGPTLTQEWQVALGSTASTSGSHSPFHRDGGIFRDLDSWRWQASVQNNAWAAVNVTQPLKHLDLIPDDISVIIGANKNEGEMFVHGAFPITMTKPVYWMFVGALFQDSASRVLKHYRGYVDQVESEARELARKQMDNFIWKINTIWIRSISICCTLHMNRSSLSSSSLFASTREKTTHNNSTATTSTTARPWHRRWLTLVPDEVVVDDEGNMQNRELVKVEDKVGRPWHQRLWPFDSTLTVSRRKK